MGIGKKIRKEERKNSTVIGQELMQTLQKKYIYYMLNYNHKLRTCLK